MNSIEFMNYVLQNNDPKDVLKKIKEHFSDGLIIPFKTKVDQCQKIAFNTCFKKDNDNNIYFQSNSIARHILLTLTLIKNYSDLDIDIDNGIDEYSIFDKQGIIRLIINNILNQKEVEEYKNILNNIVNDYIINTKISIKKS